MKTEKIVLNKCYGGFEISDEAIEELLRRKGIKFKTVSDEYGNLIFFDEKDEEIDFYYGTDINVRTDKELIKLIEEKGSYFVSRCCAKLEVEEVEKGKKFIIDEYDGYEEIKYIDDFDWIIL